MQEIATPPFVNRESRMSVTSISGRNKKQTDHVVAN